MTTEGIHASKEKRPCKGCKKLTFGWSTEGMGDKTKALNQEYTEGDRILLCPDCIDRME